MTASKRSVCFLSRMFWKVITIHKNENAVDNDETIIHTPRTRALFLFLNFFFPPFSTKEIFFLRAQNLQVKKRFRNQSTTQQFVDNRAFEEKNFHIVASK